MKNKYRKNLTARTRSWVLMLWMAAATLACTESPTAPASAPAKLRDGAAAQSIEDRLITELAPADTRAGRDRNAIINRAIDGNFDVQVAPEGYFYEIVDSGTTMALDSGSLVDAHYTGRFLDGTEFDDSRKRGEKLRFRIGGEMIAAWNLALPRLKNGGTIRLFAPSHLAYGAEGLVTPRGDTLVPAHAILEFLITDAVLVEEEL